MRKTLSLMIAGVLLIGLAAPVGAASKAELDAAVNSTAAFMLNAVKNPQVDSVGGEWAVVGLARSGYSVPDSYYENYYKTVERYVSERDGVLHDRRYTDYSRVILALTAAGYDPRSVAGYDLTVPLGDFEKTIWQGINGPVWALLALDSLNYPVPENKDAATQATRELYIAEILRRQTSDGGWNLTAGANGTVGSNETGDPGLTGMALQALAKYQNKSEVKAATDKALAFLARVQDSKGGYSGSFAGGSLDVESAVQVLVALCELGISVNDPRFVKNGNTLADNVLSNKNADGSFRRGSDGSANNQMSAEQSLYGLVAAQRAADGRISLYRMSDAVQRGELKQDETGMLETMAARYVNTTGDWEAMTMSAFDRAGEVAGATIVRNARSVYADPDSLKTDIARVIITLTSLGVDATKVHSGNDGVYLNFIEKLLEKPPAMPNDAIFGLTALDSGNYGNAQDRERYVQFLLRSQVQHAPGQIRWTWGFGDGEWDIDITAMAVTALTAYDNTARPEVRAAVNGALAFLSAQQNPQGHFGDANSTAMAVVAFAAMGIDPGTRTGDFAKDGNSLIDGLLAFQSDNYRFWIADWTTGEPTEDNMATEQGFRALVAYRGFAQKGGAYNVYRFGPQTGDGTELADKYGPGRHADVRKVPISSPGKTFEDIQNHVNQVAIEALAERGVITGKSETSFDPDATMTRAEFAAIVTRGLGLPSAGTNVFQDVPASAWYTAQVATAYHYEIIRGTSSDTFNPNGTITRQEAAVMVARAARLAGMNTGRTETEIRDTLAKFGDYRAVSGWAQESLAFCYSEGIVDDLEFDIKPGEPVQRAEIAEMLYRMLDKANLL